MKPLRLLKFDSCHPLSYLDKRQRAEAVALREFSYEQYYQWLMGLRVGLSDYLTHPMNEAGWDAREFIAQDGLLLRLLSEQGRPWNGKGVNLSAPALRHLGNLTLRGLVSGDWQRTWPMARKQWIIEKYIEHFRPDVLFIREPCHMDGKFWDRFRGKCVIASFIACNTNHAVHWDPHRSDIIFTLTPEYADFFRVQGIETHLLAYGVDERISREVENLPKQHDCTFVGYLGQSTQSRKTELMNAVAADVDFKWWGVRGPELAKYPALERAWQGETAGLDMLRIYRQSRIVLNDYVDMAAGTNVNIRTKEVMSVGSMLLTRRAVNIEGLEREGALVTFGNAEECIAKIRHYLVDESAREAIGATGLRVALRDFNYRDIAANLMRVLEAKVIERGKTWAS
jgi:hypothetical protein